MRSNIRYSTSNTVCLLLAIVLGGTLVACEPYDPHPTPTLTPSPVVLRLVTSTTLLPAASALAEAYKLQANPVITTGELVFGVENRPADQVIEAARQGMADVALVAGAISGHLPTGLEITPVSQVPLAIILHPSNPTQNLSPAQARDIFAGETLDWGSVSDASGPILVITQPPGSEAWTALTAGLMGQARITGGALVVADDQGVVELVAQEPGAIGYVALGALPAAVKVVALDGVRPTPTELAAGRYPLVEPIQIVTPSEPPAHVRDFVDFALSPAGQEVLERALGLKGRAN